jgi:hypothetical protein
VANFFHHGADPAFADLYSPMSDLELQDLLSDWHSLIPQARGALAAEFAARTLTFEEPPALIADLSQYRELITIRRYRDLSEAIVARAAIESAGIFCFLKDENFVRLEWQISNFIGGIRLQVPVDDVEATEAILSQPIPNEISIPDQPGFIQPRCPRCTSTDISWERQGRKAALASLYFFALPMPRGSESWHCNSCDLRWIDDDEPAGTPSNDNSTQASQL